MHCYRDGSCFYYCESTFNIVNFYLLLNRCKFTLNCYFCFLTFLFRFLILSCAFEHFMEFAHYKCFIIIIIIIIILLLLMFFPSQRVGYHGRVG